MRAGSLRFIAPSFLFERLRHFVPCPGSSRFFSLRLSAAWRLMSSCRTSQFFHQFIKMNFLIRGVVFVAHSNIFVSNVMEQKMNDIRRNSVRGRPAVQRSSCGRSCQFSCTNLLRDLFEFLIVHRSTLIPKTSWIKRNMHTFGSYVEV
jgi:hypothetical protein